MVRLVRCVVAILVIAAPLVCEAFCFEEAGAEYGVSPRLLWAIAKAESDFNPAAFGTNVDGTFDYGVMQINSGWYRTLGRERWMQLGDACYNVRTGAWILSQCVARYGYTWEAVGCYNAASPNKRARYARKIYWELVKAGAAR